MKAIEVRQKFINFYKERGHSFIPSAPLVPQNDPTTLFIGSGMQPILPYLLGEKHPEGDKLVDSQTCIRVEGINDDVLDVGDNRHITFFEMLGNWSLGSYFKEDQLRWIFTFLIDEIKLDPNKLYVTVLSGDKEFSIPKDEESISIWKTLFKEKGINAEYVDLDTEENGAEIGMQGARIFGYNSKKNWWSRAGSPKNMPNGEPGGPDSEMFYDFGLKHDKAFGENCHPNCDCGRFLEIGNSVFMEYFKKDNKLIPLKQKNVDFGGGLERIVAASNDDPDVFNTDLFASIINVLEENLGISYKSENQKHLRVIADHIKTATFEIYSGVIPSNKHRGYILRKLLRRAAVKVKLLNPIIDPSSLFIKLVAEVVDIYEDLDDGFGFKLDNSLLKKAEDVINEELNKFEGALEKGLKAFSKAPEFSINGEFAFDLYQNYGFPFELSFDLALQMGIKIDKDEFADAINNHRLKSKAENTIFKGGLGDHSKETTKLHTATHLLHQALRDVLGDHVHQMGSNITSERLRFDFSHDAKMTNEEIKKVEEIVNEKIKECLPVSKVIMSRINAEKTGALHFFGDKYGDEVSIYFIGDCIENAWSKEFCGGPHVKSTSKLGSFKIIKEEAVSKGVRRIKALC